MLRFSNPVAMKLTPSKSRAFIVFASIRNVLRTRVENAARHIRAENLEFLLKTYRPAD
jgi:hypothetical protein